MSPASLQRFGNPKRYDHLPRRKSKPEVFSRLTTSRATCRHNTRPAPARSQYQNGIFMAFHHKNPVWIRRIILQTPQPTRLFLAAPPPSRPPFPRASPSISAPTPRERKTKRGPDRPLFTFPRFRALYFDFAALIAFADAPWPSQTRTEPSNSRLPPVSNIRAMSSLPSRLRSATRMS